MTIPYELLFIIVLCIIAVVLMKNIENFASCTPFYSLIRTSLNNCNHDVDYETNYPFGYPPVEFTKYGAYCPHANWNTCGGCNQRIWKHF
jgi:hypothetical protein